MFQLSSDGNSRLDELVKNMGEINKERKFFVCPNRGLMLLTIFSWFNSLSPSDAYMHRQPRKSVVQILACHLFRRQAITRTIAGMLSSAPLGWNFSDILIEV